MLNCDDKAQLCLTCVSASFASGTALLTIPSECAERSTLISELRQETEDEVILPLPLPLNTFKAWLTCASVQRKEGLNEHSDDVLLGAHKAADFLRDDKTLAVVLEALESMVARAMEDTDLDPFKEDEKAAQIVKVIDALPQPAALAIIAAIYSRPGPRSETWPGQVEMLLHSLPRTHHPAIVRACYMHESKSSRNPNSWRSVFTSSERPCCEFFMRPLRRQMQHKAIWHPTVAGRTAATNVFQLLAAVVPLAGGRLDLAWALPDGHGHTGDVVSVRDEVNSSGQDIDVPAAKRMRLIPPPAHELPGGGGTVWQTASGSLKHLLIAFDVHNVYAMPSRWCLALAQLVTLQDLRIRLDGKHFDDHSFVFCMPELRSALLHLPGLTKLAFTFHLGRSHYNSNVVEFVSQNTLPLLDAVSQMPQLSHLELDGCVNLHNGRASDNDNGRLSQMPQLSQMSCLTCLRLSMYIDQLNRVDKRANSKHSPDLAISFAIELSQLPALEQLYLVFEVRDITAEYVAEVFVLELFSGPGMPAVDALHISIDRQCANELQPLLPFSRLHRCILFHNKALLGRMAALRFGPPRKRGCILYSSSAEERTLMVGQSTKRINCQAAALAAMLEAMTSLQSLSLSDVDVGIGGLLSLAQVLPGLTALTHLNIAHSGALKDGVFAILAALLEPGGPGGEGLRSLDIRNSCSLPAPEHAQQLASLLGRFGGLVQLDITRLNLGVKGLLKVVRGLSGLAQLCCVEADGNIPWTHLDRDMVGGAELKQAAATCIPAAEFKF